MDHNLPTEMWSLLTRDGDDSDNSAQKLLDLIKDPFSGEVRLSGYPKSSLAFSIN